jgi:hypothetical protein
VTRTLPNGRRRTSEEYLYRGKIFTRGELEPVLAATPRAAEKLREAQAASRHSSALFPAGIVVLTTGIGGTIGAGIWLSAGANQNGLAALTLVLGQVLAPIPIALVFYFVAHSETLFHEAIVAFNAEAPAELCAISATPEG